MTVNAHHVRYLIIGGGLAGSAAAQSIRLRDPHGSIVIVGQEINRPYNRPPVCREYLHRKTGRAAMMTVPLGWYSDNQVQLITGQRVTRIDTTRHLVAIDTGAEIQFDKALIATGVSPRPLHVPGGDLPNVYDLRTIEDAEQILNGIDKARTEGRPHNPENRSGPRGRVAVVGGGLLGVELCETFARLGLRVDLFVAHPHPWHRFAGPHVGGAITRHLEAHDIRVHTQARIAQIQGDGRAQRILLDDQRSFDTDFVVTAIGTVLNRDILRGTPINAEKQLLVDQHCRTNVQDIFAAGDCAAVFDPLFAKHRVLEHWHSARLLGSIAGANMAGDPTAVYDIVNQYTTEVFGIAASVWGESKHATHRHTRLLPSGGMLEFGVSDANKVSQTLALAAPREYESVLHDLVQSRTDVTGKIEQLIDPETPLNDLLK
ncbi:MAG TPA: FAD-dependent oxidoreductase [Tepidisphaeraceae bacterium]|nr:FAD-dependent oxidoreductase [Tepidisphaeraceae bacterium]